VEVRARRHVSRCLQISGTSVEHEFG